MATTKKVWKRGPGKLGVLFPLMGTWVAESESPIGKVRCTRSFRLILKGKHAELVARWEFAKDSYEEIAIFGVQDGGLSFWSFTSDGKRSQGSLSSARDIHSEAICFEAEMPSGRARMIYWPHDSGGFNWAVESKGKKGWRRFVEHHYVASR